MSPEGQAGIGVGASVEKDGSVAGPLGGRRLTAGEVLGAGALPMDVLERRIKSWVAQEKTAS